MNNKTLYLECYSGISGDMTVSALLDLGADEKVLKDALDSLKIEGYEIKIGRREKCGIDAAFFDVVLEEEKEHEQSHRHDHAHEHEHKHDHDHDHDHSHHHEHHNPGQHDHRNIKDIYEMIHHSDISDRAKATAKKIFDIVAKAEAKAHGIDVEKVHFHEVGAIDSIVDIVATAVCLDNLEIQDVIVSELYEGKGHVKCQHGILPVPVPAVANIAMNHSLVMRTTDMEGELVTPTGAAITAAIKTKDSLPQKYTIKNIGIGSGKKELPRANILRAYIIEDESKKKNKSFKLGG